MINPASWGLEKSPRAYKRIGPGPTGSGLGLFQLYLYRLKVLRKLKTSSATKYELKASPATNSEPKNGQELNGYYTRQLDPVAEELIMSTG